MIHYGAAPADDVGVDEGDGVVGDVNVRNRVVVIVELQDGRAAVADDSQLRVPAVRSTVLREHFRCTGKVERVADADAAAGVILLAFGIGGIVSVTGRISIGSGSQEDEEKEAAAVVAEERHGNFFSVCTLAQGFCTAGLGWWPPPFIRHALSITGQGFGEGWVSSEVHTAHDS